MAFFEEVIHHIQKKYGSMKQSDYIERVAREAAANRKLIRNSRVYGFTEDDYDEIEGNLKYWETDFKRRAGDTYDESDIRR